MKRIDTVPAAALAAALMMPAAGAEAEPFETRRLLSEAGWQVDLTHDGEDGGLWCSAETVNAAGQSLVLAAYDTGQLALFLFDPAWAMAPRALELEVELDGGAWTMPAVADGIGVTARLGDVYRTAAFLGAVRRAGRMRVGTAGGDAAASFSLAGAAAGIDAMTLCWERILMPEPAPLEAVAAGALH